MAKPKITPIPVPVELVSAILGTPTAVESLARVKTAYQNLVAVQTEVQDALDNPVAILIARGIAENPNVKIEVNKNGELFVVSDLGTKVANKPIKEPKVKKAPKAKRASKKVAAAPEKEPKVKKTRTKKGNGTTKVSSFPTISELREMAAAAGVDISGIAPQNKKAILEAIGKASQVEQPPVEQPQVEQPPVEQPQVEQPSIS